MPVLKLAFVFIMPVLVRARASSSTGILLVPVLKLAFVCIMPVLIRAPASSSTGIVLVTVLKLAFVCIIPVLIWAIMLGILFLLPIVAENWIFDNKVISSRHE